MDILIPIVFPDYKVTIEFKESEVDIFPWMKMDNFKTPSFKSKLSNLGHAGVLFINGRNGTSKYYEYGRYDPPENLGLVRKARNLPNVRVSSAGIDFSTLKATLSSISKVSGDSGRIEGAYIEVNNKYNEMLQHAEHRKAQNATASRKAYDTATNNCMHFVKEISEKAGVPTPWMVDPRPNSYISEFRSSFPDLDFKNGLLEIEGKGRY